MARKKTEPVRPKRDRRYFLQVNLTPSEDAPLELERVGCVTIVRGKKEVLGIEIEGENLVVKSQGGKDVILSLLLSKI